MLVVYTLYGVFIYVIGFDKAEKEELVYPVLTKIRKKKNIDHENRNTDTTP